MLSFDLFHQKLFKSLDGGVALGFRFISYYILSARLNGFSDHQQNQVSIQD